MQQHCNKLSFENQDFYVGIDVHKKQWTICVTHMNHIVEQNKSIDPDAQTLINFYRVAIHRPTSMRFMKRVSADSARPGNLINLG